MTFEELHEILDDETKKISLKEYKEILYQLKNDAFSKLKTPLDREYQFYNGEQNAFYVALDLSEHLEQLNQNTKAIECLRKVKDLIIQTYEPTPKATKITRFINQIIAELKGEKDE